MANLEHASGQEAYSVGLVPYAQNPDHPEFGAIFNRMAAGECPSLSEEGLLLPFSAELIKPEEFGRLCFLGMLNKTEGKVGVDPATAIIVTVEELRDANGDPLSPADLTQSLYIGRVAFAGENHPGVENFSWSPENRSPGEEYADLVKEFVDSQPQEETIDAVPGLEEFAQNRGISLEIMQALLVSARVPTPWSMKLASDDFVETIKHYMSSVTDNSTNPIQDGGEPEEDTPGSETSYIF